MNKQKWVDSLFNDLDTFWDEIVDARPTKKEVNFVDSVVNTRGLILDLCCGTARHSILLRQKGRNIVGFDVSTNLLKIAKRRMKEKNVALPLVRGEMRHLPFRASTFATVINMFTSFGYLPSKKEDTKSLKEVARVLGQNGSFLIDVANREHLINNFKKKDWGVFPTFYMLEERVLDVKRSKLHSQWILLDKSSGKASTFDHNLRLYTLPVLRKMLRETRLTMEKAYGDYTREQEFRLDSPRLIILAKRR